MHCGAGSRIAGHRLDCLAHAVIVGGKIIRHESDAVSDHRMGGAHGALDRLAGWGRSS